MVFNPIPGNRQARLRIIATVIFAAFLIMISHSISNNHSDYASNEPLTPWRCVGGCGAGGSGGTAADIKWIGTGVRGGLINAEFMGSNTIGENYRYMQLKTRLSCKTTNTTEIGVSLPIVSKIGVLQPAANYDEQTVITGGMTDLSLDFSKSIGMEGQYALQFALTCPTGQYDIARQRRFSIKYRSYPLP
jgi:hypothetical protein